MPSALTFPGVYIEEIPSGVRTITGVATSITAFVGRTFRGPLNQPTTITSYADFERIFGTTTSDSPVSFAVQDFYRNGGSQAIIVRLFENAEAATTAAAAADGGLTISASSPGDWANNLSYQTDQTNPPQTGKNFNLAVFTNPEDPNKSLILERFSSLSVDSGSPRRVDLVLTTSQYVRAALATQSATLPAVDSKPKQLNAIQGTVNAKLSPGTFKGDPLKKTGINALENVNLFNMLCLAPDDFGDIPPEVYQAAMGYCVMRRAILIVDSPSIWDSTLFNNPRVPLSNLGLSGTDARNAAIFYPRVFQPDPNIAGKVNACPPCGIVAGMFAKTDATRGVWKAPAGLDAALSGIRGLTVNLTDRENGILNPVGINCLRFFPAAGNVVWGSRTLRGDDQLGDEYKYIPVRRTALFIEESLYRGTQWALFEPNDEPLWAQLRLNIGSFMNDLFRQGAFQGRTPREAYFVKCDKETTTQSDINKGIVNVVVGFAPLKPAEFVVIKLQQIAGQLDT